MSLCPPATAPATKMPHDKKNSIISRFFSIFLSRDSGTKKPQTTIVRLALNHTGTGCRSMNPTNATTSEVTTTTGTTPYSSATRRWWWYGVLLVIVVGLGLPSAVALRCDRTPEGSGASKSPADGRFRLRISGNPDKYVPGETYTSEYWLCYNFCPFVGFTRFGGEIICALYISIQKDQRARECIEIWLVSSKTGLNF